jgi:hypothetical protein
MNKESDESGQDVLEKKKSFCFCRSSSVSIVTRLRAGLSEVPILMIPVTERSEAWVCGRSLTGVAGSNSAGNMDVCVVCYRGISDVRLDDVKEHNR